jgi:hypothetical protein
MIETKRNTLIPYNIARSLPKGKELKGRSLLFLSWNQRGDRCFIF